MISSKRILRNTAIAYTLLLPALLILIVFFYLPITYVLQLSFFDWDMISPHRTFVGIDNYRRVLDPASPFWASLMRTVQYGVIYVPCSLGLGLILALALTSVRRLRAFFQTLYFIPSVTSIAVISVVWSFLYNPQVGPINRFLLFMGVPHSHLPTWLNNPALALPSLAIMGVWQTLGFITLLLIAGIKNIPETYYDAASVDGANILQKFVRITLPLLSPVLFFVTFMLIINSFKVFGAVAIMTQGRPLGSTNVVLYLIYRYAFQFFDSGFATTASWLVFLIVFLLAVLQMKLGEKSVHYQ